MTSPSCVQNKIKCFDEIDPILDSLKKKGLKIVQCHGVFDLLHPGHIRHFKRAKEKGDVLIVTVTQDRYVNKGPGRPVFHETLRLEALAALQDVDYVLLNDTPDAVSAIQKVRPSFYVKGAEYQDHDQDVTGKIREEVLAVRQSGGEVVYTNDIVFSSSSLLNQHFQVGGEEITQFMTRLKKQYSLDLLLEKLDALTRLKVLVIGDAMIDEYQYVDPMGVSGKGVHLVARCLDKECFLGGALIIANHVAQFSSHVTLVTAIGQECPYLPFMKASLHPNLDLNWVGIEGSSSLVKKRYLMKEGNSLSKFFETYSGQTKDLSPSHTHQIVNFIEQKSSEYDLILCADFGNGFMDPNIVHALSKTSSFLALNTQTNSGNRGFNLVTKHHRADFISLNEPEMRLAMQNQSGALEGLVSDIADIMDCPSIAVTRGVKGVLGYDQQKGYFSIPPFALKSVDRIGAGDSFLSLASLMMGQKESLFLSSFFGSLAAAMSVEMVGNQEPIKKPSFVKFLTRLFK